MSSTSGDSTDVQAFTNPLRFGGEDTHQTTLWPRETTSALSSSPTTSKRGVGSITHLLRGLCLGCLTTTGLYRKPDLGGSVDSKTGLKRTLTTFDLTCIGVGGIIGAGVYVLSGQAAARYAGPAVVLSFVFSGVACFFCALCYSELSSMVPASGSAYTFASVSLGPMVGFAVGWSLILEYLIGASTVAVGWSGYLCSLFKDMGAPCTTSLRFAPYARLDNGTWVATGGVVNLPAVVVVLLIAVLQVRGMQESMTLNNIVVMVKVGVLLLFIVCCVGSINTDNYKPFVPDAVGGRFGVLGILKGSSSIFFAYIGFDSISTASAEALDPQKSVPIATMVSLIVCTALYIVVALVITGLVSYRNLDVPDPVAVAVNAAGPGLTGLRPVIKLGALFGLTSVVLVLIMGQSRIFMAMARDGNLPVFFTKVHPLYKTPVWAIAFTGIAASVLAGLLPVDVLAELVSIGTLFAFVVVCLGTLYLRHTHPLLPRPFRVPYSPYFPAAGAILSLAQLFALPPDTLWQVLLWMLAGGVYYFITHEGYDWEDIAAEKWGRVMGLCTQVLFLGDD